MTHRCTFGFLTTPYDQHQSNLKFQELPSFRLKRAISIAFILLISLSFILNIGAFMWYELDKANIKKNLCENVNRPKLHCNGKCALSKKLKAENPVQTSDERTMNVDLRFLTFIVSSVDGLSGTDLSLLIQFQSSDSKPQSTYFGKIFHPPRIV